MKTTLAAIQAAIISATGVDWERVRSNRRTPDLVLARRLGVFFARRHTDASFPTIAKWLGLKSHTSAMQGYNRFMEERHQRTLIIAKVRGAVCK